MIRSQILLVIVVRTLFIGLIVFGLNQIDSLGTSPFALAAAVFGGVTIASLLAFSRLSQRGFFVLLALVGALYWLMCLIAPLLPMEGKLEVLEPYHVVLHTGLILLAAAVGAVSTWGFWRLRDTPTLELLILLSCSVLALSGHREFRLDNPQSLSAFAWDLGIDQIYMFALTGILITVVTLTYLALASLPVRQRLISNWSDFSLFPGRHSFLRSFAIILIVSILFGMSFHYIYQFYHRVSVSRLTNGVGDGDQEGLSPLGFHSALGSTNQPAALVRLDGDYGENPFTPMLYLRENALSEYNGHEMVIAASKYDNDIAGNLPVEPFDGTEDPDLVSRTLLTQSIYLLADHKLTMSVDYPLSIRPLRNPNPAKFKGSFRANSLAPAFSKDMVAQAAVGDPRWSEETRAHYLKTSQDTRYRELAETVTNGFETPLKKARALVQYLSEKSIYTLTPNHEVAKDADQTAPYLFGDMRGYCVHFAHATVYMLRALGIPARIGTGYLTDLSQSKDGHILLRMSDRHAWAEVYIHEIGWVPFDTQPAQVESHGDTQVDMKLLEDLMDLLEPGEEILPKDLKNDEPAFEEGWQFSIPLPSRTAVLGMLLLLLAGLILSKLYLRYGWALTSSPALRLKRSYIALASRLVDLGYQRRRGETRAEYRERLSYSIGDRTLSLGELLTLSAYGRPDRSPPAISEIDSIRNQDLKPFKKFSSLQKISAAFSPASVLRFFSRGGW